MSRSHKSPPRATSDRGVHSVVCGVDGLGRAREAVRQSALLAGGEGALELVTVVHPSDRSGPAPTAALSAAERLAREYGPAVTTREIAARSPADGLIRAAAEADLLAIGCDALGPTPTAVLRRASCSVLFARRPPDLPFLDTILVACGGGPLPHVRAAEIALVHGSRVRCVRRESIAIAAAAIGAGLIVAADDPSAAHLARIAPCSVLVAREAQGWS